MTMGKNTYFRPAGHVLVPAAAIGSLSVLLASGLGALGILSRVNLAISKLVSQGKPAAGRSAGVRRGAGGERRAKKRSRTRQ